MSGPELDAPGALSAKVQEGRQQRGWAVPGIFTMVVLRVGQAVLSLFAVAMLVFFLIRLTGDPVRFLLPQESTPEQYAQLTHKLRLDEPLINQVLYFLGTLARGDLGQSYRLGTPVIDLVAQRAPATLALGGAAVLLTVVVAVPLGVYSAYWRTSWLDRVVRLMAALGQAVPSFWLGLILILFFAVYLDVLPSGGRVGALSLVLPVCTLAFEPIARLTRLLRASVIEELGSDHVKFLRIKGLPERKVIWKHSLRNAGLTSLTFVGVLTSGLLKGSVLVETVFVWPGLGSLLIESVHYRDFAVVQGLTILFSALVIIVNLIVDILYMLLNPRLRT